MKKEIKFRASSAGLLMVGGKSITGIQLQELQSLEERAVQSKSGLAKPLTPIMEAKVKELSAKRDAPFELSQTAKSYVESVWLQNEYNYRPVVVTDVLLKGHLCEQDSIELVSSLVDSLDFRLKNTHRFEDDYFQGTPDIVLWSDDMIEDIKSCWDLKTFFDKKEIDPLYFAQGQVYMELAKLKKFKLHYCLVDTPMELIASEQRRYFFKYGSDENNPYYQRACELILQNHQYNHIDDDKRLRTFEIDYDPEYIKELKMRVEAAREYYKTLSL